MTFTAWQVVLIVCACGIPIFCLGHAHGLSEAERSE